jgi:hypothetical protein
MAQMSAADLIDYVRDHIPDKNQQKILRAANMVIQRIYGEVGQVERSTFTTKAPITTGTVSATQENTAVTFSSAVLGSTFPMMYLKIEGDSTWYTLTYVNTTSGTLSSAFAGDTGAALTYTLAFPVISFPTNVQQVLSIWQETFAPLRFAATERTPGLAERRTELATGRPEYYAPYLFDSSGTTPNDEKLRVILSPAPDDIYAFTYAYKRRPSLLTPGGATSQTLLLPDFFNEAIMAGTLFHCWDQEDAQERSQYWLGLYEAAWRRAMAQVNVSAVTRLEDAYDGQDFGPIDAWPVG